MQVLSVGGCPQYSYQAGRILQKRKSRKSEQSENYAFQIPVESTLVSERGAFFRLWAPEEMCISIGIVNHILFMRSTGCDMSHYFEK